MLTKAEIGKLTVEQQEILAQLELTKARHRQKLMEKARGRDWRSRYFPFFIFGPLLVGVAFMCYFGCFHTKEWPLMFLMLWAGTMIPMLIFFIGYTNRRVDAALELLDLDRKEQEDRKSPTDQKTG